MRHIIARSMGLLLVTVLCCAACGASSHEPPGSNTPPVQDPATPPAATPPAATPPGETIVAGSDPCQRDADCVPVCGCHPAACVAKATAPACEGGMMCTQECRPGTMDCGGGCLCKEGRCAARLVDAPDR